VSNLALVTAINPGQHLKVPLAWPALGTTRREKPNATVKLSLLSDIASFVSGRILSVNHGRQAINTWCKVGFAAINRFQALQGIDQEELP